MKSRSSLPLTLLIISLLGVLSVAKDFDFFYFVQQWPGSYCDTKRSCCYPRTGKPASDFGIHGLWPNYNNGGYPSNCDPDAPFDPSKIKDLVARMQVNWPTLACPSADGYAFWGHEWEKHGTCSESILDQHSYFQSALKLKDQVNLLQILQNAGVKPDRGYYSVSTIEEAITKVTGYAPGIQCNRDQSGNSQLFQIYLCVDRSATKFIQCPVNLRKTCPSRVEFPKF